MVQHLPFIYHYRYCPPCHLPGIWKNEPEQDPQLHTEPEKESEPHIEYIDIEDSEPHPQPKPDLRLESFGPSTVPTNTAQSMDYS